MGPDEEAEVNAHGDATKAAGQQFWNSTVTSWSHGAKELWKNPRVTVIRIEVLVSLVAGVLLLLAIFGSCRRRSRNWFVQKGVFGAFTLSFSMASYILGSMQSSEVKSSMYPIWAISLFILHACTDSITAYTLDDNRQEIRLQYQAHMYYAYAFLLLLTVRTDYNPVLPYMAIIAYHRYLQRSSVCDLASYSWNLNKMVADYMYEEQTKGVFATMETCNYLVDWPLNKSKFDASTSYATQLTVGDHDEEDKIIDVGKIWGCKDKSLSPELKDACLSFSLFHLLRRRFFGFACDESKDMAHDFVFKGLLSDGATDYNRVFKVIDVELAFMYDFFFTKYAVIYYGSMAATIWSLFSIIGISITSYVTTRAPLKVSQDNSAIARTVTNDVVITLVILASTALLEFLQLLFYWMGIWGRVSFVCQTIREQARINRNQENTGGSCSVIVGFKEFVAKIGVCLSSCIMGLKGFLAKIGVRFAPNNHYWQHKLGHYSLLDAVSYNPNLSEPKSTNRLFISQSFVMVAKFLYHTNYAFIHRRNDQASMIRKKAGKSVELPDEVNKAVICSLKRTGGTLSNGRSSLVSNGAQHLLWACEWEVHPDPSWSQRKQNQTHIILSWHIATCYCEMLTHSPEFEVTFSTATKLSKYCAYLVVSAPRLLPGHHYDTRSKFDAAAVEAIKVLGKSTNKYQDMKSLVVSAEPTKTIFESGVKLGRQLEGMEEGTRWKVMADFWAEMMLYLAPSDNVQEHIEQLAQGGEFITHLWALLSHAGILEREQEHQAGGV